MPPATMSSPACPSREHRAQSASTDPLEPDNREIKHRAGVIGIGFQRGTHTCGQLVNNEASRAHMLVDMAASFAITTDCALPLMIAASPNASSVWARVVDEVSGAVFEQELAADLPAANQFLSPQLFINNGATAAAVAFDCSGVYAKTDS